MFHRTMASVEAREKEVRDKIWQMRRRLRRLARSSIYLSGKQEDGRLRLNKETYQRFEAHFVKRACDLLDDADVHETTANDPRNRNDIYYFLAMNKCIQRSLEEFDKARLFRELYDRPLIRKRVRKYILKYSADARMKKIQKAIEQRKKFLSKREKERMWVI